MRKAMEYFVIAATFTYPHEIAVLRHRLEQEGIAHFFENETMLSVAPFYSFALGGIKLRVHRDDLTQVRSIVEGLSKGGHLNIV